MSTTARYKALCFMHTWENTGKEGPPITEGDVFEVEEDAYPNNGRWMIGTLNLAGRHTTYVPGIHVELASNAPTADRFERVANDVVHNTLGTNLDLRDAIAAALRDEHERSMAMPRMA